jgi:hypothetical protein
VTSDPTLEVATFFVRGVDTAFDPNTNSYLIVGGQGVLVGVCVNANGIPISGVFTINGEGHGQFPRARYSPHVFGSGGFLVTWPEEVGATVELHARPVNCSGGLGAEQVISGGHSAWLESGAAVAYSTTSQRFLVVWKSFPLATAPIRVKAVLVDNNGSLASGVVDLSSGFGRDPGVTWNPSLNQFAVSFSGESGDRNPSFSAFAIVPASNPAAFTRTTFNTIFGGLTTITDIDYNPVTNRYIMTWFEFSSAALAMIAEFDTAGTLISQGPASSRLGSYDALSTAYNPVSGTFLLVGVDRSNDAVLGLELNSRGFPFNGENTLSSTHRPSYYNRVAASNSSRSWDTVFAARSFNGIGSFIARSFASGGGPAGAHGGGGGSTDPQPPPPSSSGCTTIQPGPDWQCVNGNWLPPSTTSPSPTSSCTTVQPGPGWVCVNGNWLPSDSPSAPSPTSSCTTVQPGPGWVCVNGNWLPSDSPLAPPPPSSSCPTVQPGPGWVCVNGNWLPPDSPLAPPSTSSCPTIQPAPGWVCVNGNWLPPDSPLAPPPPTSSCTTIQPGPGWVCVNGGWLPPDAAPTPSSGGGGGGCTTIQPGPGWVCVNGNWLPPDSSEAQALSGGCTGSAPASGWVCINGGWLPPDHPLVTGGGNEP